MPSVAAEAQAVLPSRPNLPSARAYSNADSGNATPFADLLDSPPPAAEPPPAPQTARTERPERSEEHTSELQSHSDLVCRLLLEKKKN